MKPPENSADSGAGSGCMARLVRFFSSFCWRRATEILRYGCSLAGASRKSQENHPKKAGVLSPSTGTRTSCRGSEQGVAALEFQESTKQPDLPLLDSGTSISSPSSVGETCLLPPTRDTSLRNEPVSNLVALRRCLAEHPEMLASLQTIAWGYKPEGYLSLPANLQEVLVVHS